MGIISACLFYCGRRSCYMFTLLSRRSQFNVGSFHGWADRGGRRQPQRRPSSQIIWRICNFYSPIASRGKSKKSCVTLDDWYCNWLLVALSGPRGHGSAARSNLDDWQLACTRVPNSNNSWHLFGRTYPIAPHRCARCLALLLHTP